jgi:hypothetical protein
MRALFAGRGGVENAPIVITVDAPLRGLRIHLSNYPDVLPIKSLSLFSATSPTYTQIKLTNPRATYNQENHDIGQAIDGNSVADNSGWGVDRPGESQVAVFELANPIRDSKDGVLLISLYENYFNGGPGDELIGRFRVSVTDVSAPLSFGLPPEIARIVNVPSGSRSKPDVDQLFAYAREHDNRHRELRDALAKSQLPLADDAKLKQLETELSQAKKPLPLDPRLQELRRAATLSDQQLVQKRLTAAQDLAWALINSPEFLYNH